MINRNIPYGYYVQNAQIIINETEANVIRNVFHSYVSGASLKYLAVNLTRAKVEYLPGKRDWDSNRVYRLIQNEKYAGKSEFPPIIAEDDYHAAQAIRGKRGHTKSCPEGLTTITDAVTPILCGACNSPVVRHRGRTGSVRQKYVCSNPDCKKEFRITDAELTAMVREHLQNTKIRLPDQQDCSLEVRKLKNEITRLLESPEADPKELRCRIFDLAAEKYRLLTAGLAITEKLRTDLVPANLSSSNIRKTVMEAVKQIRLIDDCTIEVTLINSQIV